MKLQMGYYTVDIKVHTDFNTRNNHHDTIDFLNTLSLMCDEYSKHYAELGAIHASEYYKEMSSDIFKALDEVGAYDNI